MIILRKVGPCADCPPGCSPRILVDGRCVKHYFSHRAAINREKRKKNHRPNDEVNPNSQNIDSQSLKNWYDYHILRAENELFWICENCKKPIFHMGEASRFSCQAHILPKEYFPSVETNIHNHMLLGGIFSDCGCHYSFDLSWKRAEKMPVFQVAISRFLLFKNELSEKEISILPYPFKPYL